MASVSKIPFLSTPARLPPKPKTFTSNLSKVLPGETKTKLSLPVHPLQDLTNTDTPRPAERDGRKRAAPSFMAPTAATTRKASRDPSPKTGRSASLERDRVKLSAVSQKPPFIRKEDKIIAKLEETLKEKEEMIERLTLQLECSSSKVSHLEEIVQMKNEIIETKTMRNDSLESKLSTIELKMKAVQEERESLREKCSLLIAQEENQKTKISITLDQLTEARKELSSNDTVVRKLLNEVVDLRGQIRVAIRVRPSLPNEENLISMQYPSQTSIRLDMNGKMTTLDYQKVYGPNITQKTIFGDVEELVMSSLHGYNVAIIAYGQTGSGKTHTMIGGKEHLEGLIPRSARSIFKNKNKLAEIGWKFDISASFLEIYVEEVYDLLNNRQKVQLRSSYGNCIVEGAVCKQIETEEDISWILHTAAQFRSVAVTKCNEQSSRSHAIFQINISAKNEVIGMELNSCLSLVDLAGSERVKESGSDENKDRFKEMTSINLGLSCLQKCIRSQLNKSSHIPYRDSKLTHMLMNSLGGGDSKTMVIVGLNPSFSQEAETKRSLEFAQQMSLTKIGAPMKQMK